MANLAEMAMAVMMGQIDRDCIPPYAVTMWTNDVEIFVALPMAQGGIPVPIEVATAVEA